MNVERQRLIEAIFLDVVGAEPGRRGALLDARCAGDAAVRADVESLLEHHEADGKFLNDAEALAASAGLVARGPGGAEEPHLPPGSSAGGYTVKKVLGSGGMGVVYLAEQERPRRTVALKVIRRGLTTRAILRRFEHEAEVLGRLHHPGIAHIFEAGAAEFDPRSGPQAFIAMEFVHGVNLCEHADARRLGTRERLELMVKVCDAVQHAHQRGVIHRDLKPANILVEEAAVRAGREGSRPEGAQPKVLDFGVARATDADLSVTTLQTSVGQLIGTLPYMSPEQVLADPNEIDTRSDVYSLGVILYQLLTSKLPHDVGSRSIPEAARVIRDEKPARLSAVSKVFRGEIETIVAKALEKDRERRYQSAADLGEDLRRYLDGRPIAAKDDSALYVLRKQIKRYQGVVAAVCVLVILLAVFAVYANVQAERSASLAERETQARSLADAARESAERQRSRAEAERARADAESERLRRSLYFNRIGFAHAAYLGNDPGRVGELLGECPKDLRGWEWDYLKRLSDRSAASIKLFDLGHSVLAASADHLTLAVGGVEGGAMSVRVLGIKAGGAPGRPEVRSTIPTAGYYSIAVSPRGELVALGDAAGVLTLFDASTGSRVRGGDVFAGAAAPTVRGLTVYGFSPDGSRILVGKADGAVLVVDAETLRTVLTLPPRRGVAGRAIYTPDGSAIVTGAADGVCVRDAATGEVRRFIESPSVRVVNMALNTSGTRAVTADYDLRLRMWDLEKGEMLWETRPHGAPFDGVAFAPDGSTVATACDDSTVKLHDAATGKTLRTFRGHTAEVGRVAYTADSAFLVTQSPDGTVRWWSTRDGADLPTINIAGWGTGLGFSPDSRWVAVATSGGQVQIFDPRTLEQKLTFKAHTGIVYTVQFGADGSEVLTASGADGLVRVWDAATGGMKSEFFGCKGEVQNACFGPGTGRITSCGDDGYVRVWDRATGKEIRAIRAHEKPIVRVRVSPDDKWIVTGSRDKTVRLFNASDGALARTMEGHGHDVYDLSFRRGTTELASASEDGTIRVWDLATGACVRVLEGTGGPVCAVVYSADGRRLASSGWDCGLRLWDADSGEQILYSRGHLFLVFTIAFSPDGARIVTASQDSTARVWESTPTR